MEQPALDPEVLAQLLHVPEQMGRGVVAHVGRRVARVRSAATASALIEQHDPEALRVEHRACTGRAAGAGATVDDEGDLAARVAADLPVDEVAVTGIEHAVVVGLDRWMDHEALRRASTNELQRHGHEERW